MEIGQKIRFLREEKKLTQGELAKLINLSRQALSHYEKNEREPNIETIRKLCVFFCITADELLEIETEKQRKEIEINNSFNNNNGTINFKN